MSEITFLKHLITEDIYLIKEKNIYNEIPEKEVLTVTEPVIEIKKDILPNKKAIAIVSNKVSEAEKELMFKIFKAINLTENDIECIVFNQFEFSTETVHSANKIIISFGVSTNIIPYSIEKINNAHIISADSLQKLESSADLKRQLWGLLKSCGL